MRRTASDGWIVEAVLELSFAMSVCGKLTCGQESSSLGTPSAVAAPGAGATEDGGGRTGSENGWVVVERGDGARAGVAVPQNHAELVIIGKRSGN